MFNDFRGLQSSSQMVAFRVGKQLLVKCYLSFRQANISSELKNNFWTVGPLGGNTLIEKIIPSQKLLHERTDDLCDDSE